MPTRFKVMSCVFALAIFAHSGCSLLSKNTEETDGANDEVRAATDAEVKKQDEERKALEQAAAEGQNKPEPVNAEASLKKKVLVLKFQNRTLFGGDELGQYAEWDVADQIAKKTDIVVIHPDDINNGENFYTQFNDYNWKTIMEKARANGVAGVVTGTIEDLMIQEKGDEVGIFRTRYHTVSATVKFQLHDVNSEKIIFTKVANAETTDETTRIFGSRSPDAYDAQRARSAVQKALEATMGQLQTVSKRIAWVGRIAKIDMHRYYINAGSTTGLSRGQILKVFADGAPVVDHDSGGVIGIAPGRFKGTLRIVDYFGTDGTVAVMHSGAGFKEKDRVELFTP